MQYYSINRILANKNISGPVKPKPQLKDRRSSKKDLEEAKLVARQATFEGEDEEVSIEVTQTMTTADDCTLMMTTEGDLATPDSEEFSFGGVSAAEPAEICALCPSPTLSARLGQQYHILPTTIFNFDKKYPRQSIRFQDSRTWSL